MIESRSLTYSLVETTEAAVPLHVVTSKTYPEWTESLDPTARSWLAATGFKGQAGKLALLPSPDGSIAAAIQGIDPADPVWALAPLPAALPDGTYRLVTDLDALADASAATRATLGWALATYRFDRYRARPEPTARLVWPETADRPRVEALAEAYRLARDLINTPTEDMGPDRLAEAIEALGARHGAHVTTIVGAELLSENYPLIHAVGRASAVPPRLVDLVWGDENAPKVTLVGKGVCFDSGGLDIKPSSAMRMMKKDMGGAATLIGLAHAIMALKLPVRLRLLVPAVENAISANAFRPGDVFTSRKGLTVEIGNTDAEGRLVLCDALAEAAAEQPDLLIDVATLTGAARTALGPELPALFTDNESLAAEFTAAAGTEFDPVWRLPLWQPYRTMMDSKIADITNASESGFAGAITAALYLKDFIPPETSWAHLDSYAWNPKSRPGRPEGGEPLGLRTLLAVIEKRFGA